MASKFARFGLFLSSYLPLAVMMFFMYKQEYYWVAVAILGIATLGMICLSVFLKQAQRIAPMTVRLTDCKRKDGEVIGYIVTYIIPFLVTPADGWQKWTALGLFFAMIGVLYTNSNLIHINPTLNLCNYQLYEIITDSGETASLITKRRSVRKNESIEVVTIAEAIYLEKEKKQT